MSEPVPTSPAPVVGRTVSLVVLTVCIAALGLTFFHIIAPFLLPLFLAAILAIVCQPLYRHMLKRSGGHASIAAGLTTAVLVAVVLIPVLLGTVLAASQLMVFSDEYLSRDNLERNELWSKWVEPLIERASKTVPGLGTAEDVKHELETNGQILAKNMAGRTLLWASSTIGAAMSLMVTVGMFLVSLYYFLADGPALIAASETLIPLPVEHQRRMRHQFAKVTRAVVLATFMAAFAQGVATAAALKFLGFGYFLGFLALSTIAALVPLVGTWLVWVPCAAWLAIQGHWAAAIGLALWGSIVIGLLDNIVRTYVLNSDAQLHPLLAFVSVLGALQVMGLWGIFIGPIVASCLSALLQIFNSELQAMVEDRGAARPPV